MTDVALDPKALEKAAKAAYEGVYPFSVLLTGGANCL